ncbi:heterochromatin protein 1-like isoform X1 [Schistocerca americana]|uniref:heterochromatin protein 1-like isoform X1 n=1 Tax=Schistocerca americana TaxID=7009 RepID=UPI001F500D55|nr:heterochromatin protein 1-like isoform X1 [Schistocerca americana]
MRRAAAVRARQRKLREENANQEAESVTTTEDSTPKAATNTKGGRNRKAGVSKQKETDTESESQSVEHKEGQSADGDSSEEQYEVEKIVDMKVIRGVRKYRIRWKGYDSGSDTWEIADNLNCPNAVKEYLDQNSRSEEISVTNGRKRASKVDVVSEEAVTNNTQNTENDTSAKDEEENMVCTPIPPAKKRKSSKVAKVPKNDDETADDENEEEESEEKAVEEPTVKEENVKTGRTKAKGKKEGTVSSEETENGVNPDETSYEVEKIMEVHHKRNGKKEYLIHWRGYPHSQDTWEPEENLDCEELIREFEERVKKAKNLNVRELRTDPAHTNRYAEEQSAKRQSKRGKGKKRTTYYDTE